MPAEPTYVIFVREDRGLPKVINGIDRIPPDKTGFEYTALALLPYRELDNGLPVDGELSRMTGLEEQIEEALAPFGAFHLGHITFNGAMQTAFLAPKEVPTELKLKIGPLEMGRIKLDVLHDPSHSWFQNEMAPTEVEFEISKFRTLHQTLTQHNDNPHAIRQVDFWAYFKTAELRSNFLASVLPNGYRLSSESEKESESDYPFGCEFAADSDVLPQTMGTRCAFLRQEALKQEGDFDGWACPVVKS